MAHFSSLSHKESQSLLLQLQEHSGKSRIHVMNALLSRFQDVIVQGCIFGVIFLFSSNISTLVLP